MNTTSIEEQVDVFAEFFDSPTLPAGEQTDDNGDEPSAVAKWSFGVFRVGYNLEVGASIEVEGDTKSDSTVDVSDTTLYQNETENLRISATFKSGEVVVDGTRGTLRNSKYWTTSRPISGEAEATWMLKAMPVPPGGIQGAVVASVGHEMSGGLSVYATDPDGLRDLPTGELQEPDSISLGISASGPSASATWG